MKKITELTAELAAPAIAEDYLLDFYLAGMDMAGIAGRIMESTEQTVNAALFFPPDVEDETLLSAAEDCRRWKGGGQQ